jgi:hypothetical protein
MGRIIPAGTGIVPHTEGLVESLAGESEAAHELEIISTASDDSDKLEAGVALSTGGSEAETLE